MLFRSVQAPTARRQNCSGNVAMFARLAAQASTPTGRPCFEARAADHLVLTPKSGLFTDTPVSRELDLRDLRLSGWTKLAVEALPEQAQMWAGSLPWASLVHLRRDERALRRVLVDCSESGSGCLCCAGERVSFESLDSVLTKVHHHRDVSLQPARRAAPKLLTPHERVFARRWQIKCARIGRSAQLEPLMVIAVYMSIG